MTTFTRIARSEGRELAPEGWHRLRIRDAFETKAASGRDAVLFLLDFVDDPKRYRSIKHWANLPREGDGARTVKAITDDLRSFFDLFRVPYAPEGFDEVNSIGCGATAFVGVSRYRAGGTWRKSNALRFPQPGRWRLTRSERSADE